MNNCFNITRYKLFFRKQMLDDRKKWIFLFSTITIILAGAFIITRASSFDQHYQFVESMTIFSIISFWIIGIFTTRHYMSRTKKISYLLLPVSATERFVQILVETFIIYPIVFGAAFLCANMIYLAMSAMLIDYAPMVGINPFISNISTGADILSIILIIALYFLTQCMFILFGTIWNKYSLIAGAMTVGGIILVIVFEAFIYIDKVGGNIVDPNMSEDTWTILVIITAFLIAIAHLAIAAKRIKELESFKSKI